MSNAAGPDLKTRHLRIRGRVQGVGFRIHFQLEAERHGVTGWVRNRNDGSVEAIIHGAGAAVQKVIDWAHRGPSHASVTEIDVSEADGAYSGFEQRPTQ